MASCVGTEAGGYIGDHLVADHEKRSGDSRAGGCLLEATSLL
jgi:hypothetical protein